MAVYLDDRTLVKQLLGGDKAAFGRFFDDNFAALVGSLHDKACAVLQKSSGRAAVLERCIIEIPGHGLQGCNLHGELMMRATPILVGSIVT